MSYNQYGGNPYGAPPGYGGYGNPPPGMGAPPGLAAPPPGVPARPGPPGMQQANVPPAGRGAPASFQPPNLPNINFSAPVIRLGTTGPSGGNERGDGPRPGGRPGLGMDRGLDQGRSSNREATQILIPYTAEEKLRTMFIHEIPDGVSGDGIQKVLSSVGRLRRWEALDSVMDDHKGAKFGFALFEDVGSLHNAARLLVEEEVQVPKAKQPIATEQPKDDTFEGVETVKLHTSLDASTVNYLEAFRKDEEEADAGEAHARAQLRQALRDLFYPLSASTSGHVDTAMDYERTGEAIEIVNIGMGQEDELSDIPSEIREVVLKEIAAFRERSNQHDLERLRGEEEFEEQERRRNGASRPVATHDGSNGTPLGPRGAPSGPRAHNGNGNSSFVNGGVENGSGPSYRDDDTDASDEELQRRHLREEQAEADKSYEDAERRWANRERARQAALDREQNREKNGAEAQQQRAQARLAQDKEWDDEREAGRKSHPYYRDRAAWARKRGMDRADEEARDEADRRQERDEQRRTQAQLERARGMADSFLDKQAEESDRAATEAASAAAAAAASAAAAETTAAAPQPFKLSLGAAAQKAHASRTAATQRRRTVAEVEGLLDDEEEQAQGTRRRQLIPMEPVDTRGSGTGADGGMTEEEVSRAVRALAQEIPSDRDGLWAWPVQWDYMDDGVMAGRLRPFVERKIVEYLGVQEEMLVEAVEEHLRKHGTAAALVEELEGALDDEAEDLVKKLWRMVIFFTESEKRGLPA